MNFHDLTLVQFRKQLAILITLLDKAEADAATRKYDVNVLVHARLTPDMWPLSRQVAGAADAAKFCVAYLSGKAPPRYPDTEATIDELRVRLRNTLDYLATVGESDFEGAEARTVSLPFLPGKVLSTSDYVIQMALPNFYFHATMVYALLRDAGVQVSKLDFIGDLPAS